MSLYQTRNSYLNMPWFALCKHMNRSAPVCAPLAMTVSPPFHFVTTYVETVKNIKTSLCNLKLLASLTNPAFTNRCFAAATLESESDHLMREKVSSHNILSKYGEAPSCLQWCVLQDGKMLIMSNKTHMYYVFISALDHAAPIYAADMQGNVTGCTLQATPPSCLKSFQ